MTRATLSSSQAFLATEYDLALVDLDGVAYRGPYAIEHAASSLAAARQGGMQLIYVTNNAAREPHTVAEQLTALEMPATASDIMTSAQAAAQLLATRLAPGAKVLVVGAAGLRSAVTEAGFEIVASADDAPDAVVQGFDPMVTWEDLAEAAYAVQRGAWFVASNRDLSIPRERGVAPGNGSLVNAVVAATGVEPVSAGKPEPTMYHLAIERSADKRALVIGDRLDTDLAGARSGDLAGLLVLTGVNTGRDAVLAPSGLRPHFIGLDLRALHQVHTRPAKHEERWELGEQWARICDGQLELSPEPRNSAQRLDRVRCACEAVWEAVDAGAPVNLDSVPEFPME